MFVSKFTHDAVARVLVGVQRYAVPITAFCDEAIGYRSAHPLDALRRDALGASLLHAHDWLLAYGPAPLMRLFRGVFVSLFTADPRFVNFQFARHLFWIGFGIGSAETMREMPCALLGNINIRSQFGTGNAFQIRGHKVHGNGPHAKAEVRSVHKRIGLGCEVLAAWHTPPRPPLLGVAF